MAGTTTVAKYLVVFESSTAGLKIAETQLRRLKGSMKDVSVSVKGFAEESKHGSKSVLDLAGSFGKLAIRAAVVIPVWWALREGFMSFVRSIQEGLKYMTDLDKAMNRALVVTEGKDLKTFRPELQKEFQNLAGKTGAPATEVAEAYHQLASAGLSAEEAIAGMQVSIKTSIAMMGDSKETTRTLADLYNMLGDSIKDATTPTEKMQKIASTMAVLWRPNVFELNEFTDSMKNFAAIGKNFNLTMDEMMALSATAHTLMQRGATAGTQLSRSFLMMTERLDKVEVFLGKPIDRNNLNMFNLFLEVITKANKELKQTGFVADEIEQLFGMKGGLTVQTMVSSLGKLSQNLKLLNSDYATTADRMKVLEAITGLSLLTIPQQTKRFGELKNQIMSTFLFGERGTVEFAKGMSNVNDVIETKTVPAIRKLHDEMIKFIEDAGKDVSKKGIFKAFSDATSIYVRSIAKSQAGGVAGYELQGGQYTDDVMKFINDIVTGKKLSQVSTATSKTNIGKSLKDVWDIYVKQVGQDTVNLPKISATKADKTNLELINYILNVNKKVTEEKKEQQYTVEEQLMLAEKLAILGYNEIEIEKAKIEILQKYHRDSQEQAKQREKIMQLEIQRLVKYNDMLQNSFEDNLAGVFRGEKTFTSALSSIKNKMMEAFSEAQAKAVTGKLFKNLKLGEIFSGAMVDVEDMFKSEGEIISDAHVDGAKLAAPILTQAIVAGASQSMIAKGGTTGGGMFEQFAPLASSLLKISKYKQTQKDIDAIENIVGGGSTQQKKADGGFTLPGLGRGGMFEGFSNKKFFASKTGAKGSGIGSQGGVTGGQMFGAAMGAYQLSQAYKQKGSGDVGGGALSGAMAGASIGSMLGPIGTAVGAAVGAIYGAIQSGKSKTTEEIVNQTFQVSSRLDITNKTLQVINRNLIAQTMELTYFLRESAYFSEKRGTLEDEFSLYGKRGTV